MAKREVIYLTSITSKIGLGKEGRVLTISGDSLRCAMFGKKKRPTATPNPNETNTGIATHVIITAFAMCLTLNDLM